MKINAHSHGSLQFEDADLLEVLKILARENAGDFVRSVNNYLSSKGYQVKKLQRDPELKTVIAEFSQTVNEGVTPFAMSKKAEVGRDSNEGFTRNFKGFYNAVLEILKENHMNGEISFTELYEKIKNYEDSKGRKLFWRRSHNGEMTPIERSRFIQYLAPSQIHPKKNPRFKNITTKKDRTGLKWQV